MRDEQGIMSQKRAQDYDGYVGASRAPRPWLCSVGITISGVDTFESRSGMTIDINLKSVLVAEW